MSEGRVLTLEIDACPACPEGASKRFMAVGAPRTIERVVFEPEGGPAGVWLVAAEIDDDDAALGTRVSAVEVEVELESGVCMRLVTGGRRGLRLVHERTGATLLAPFITFPPGS